jgi:hypothetical protein
LRRDGKPAGAPMRIPANVITINQNAHTKPPLPVD